MVCVCEGTNTTVNVLFDHSKSELNGFKYTHITHTHKVTIQLSINVTASNAKYRELLT